MNDVERALRRSAPDARGEEDSVTTMLARARAEGAIDISYAEVDTPVGLMLCAVSDRGLIRVSLRDHDGVVDELARRVSPRVVRAPAQLDETRRQFDEYFEGTRRDFDLQLDWALVEGFHRAVLRECARIPYGGVSSYGELAALAGSPRAARAAGNALHRNPIPVVVPCHRVLHSGGGLGGYGGGLDMKRFLLRLEGAWD